MTWLPKPIVRSKMQSTHSVACRRGGRDDDEREARRKLAEALDVPEDLPTQQVGVEHDSTQPLIEEFMSARYRIVHHRLPARATNAVVAELCERPVAGQDRDPRPTCGLDDGRLRVRHLGADRALGLDWLHDCSVVGTAASLCPVHRIFTSA